MNLSELVSKFSLCLTKHACNQCIKIWKEFGLLPFMCDKSSDSLEKKNVGANGVFLINYAIFGPIINKLPFK